MFIVQATGDRTWQLIYLNCDEGSLSRLTSSGERFQIMFLMMSIGKPMKRSCSARNGDAPWANPNKTKHNKKRLGLPSLSVRSSRLR